MLGPRAGEIREELNAADRDGQSDGRAAYQAVRGLHRVLDANAANAEGGAITGPLVGHMRPWSHWPTIWWTTAWTCTLVAATTLSRASRSTRAVRSSTTWAILSVHRSGATSESLTAMLATATYQDGILQEVRLLSSRSGRRSSRAPSLDAGRSDDAVSGGGQSHPCATPGGLRAVRHANRHRERCRESFAFLEKRPLRSARTSRTSARFRQPVAQAAAAVAGADEAASSQHNLGGHRGPY